MKPLIEDLNPWGETFRVTQEDRELAFDTRSFADSLEQRFDEMRNRNAVLIVKEIIALWLHFAPKMKKVDDDDVEDKFKSECSLSSIIMRKQLLYLAHRLIDYELELWRRNKRNSCCFHVPFCESDVKF